MTLDEALELHRNGQLAAADAAYAAVLALAPEEAQFLLSLGGVQLHRGDEDGARASIEAVLVLDPNSTEAHALLGYLAMQAGDAVAAESRFRVGRRADDEDPMLLLGLGNVHLTRGDAATAVKYLSRAAEARPDDAVIQATLGQALFAQGTYGFAERALRNALVLRPQLSFARLFLGRALLRQDRTEAAREQFAALAESGRQPFGAWLGLGDVAQKQGHLGRAIKYYRRALAIDPAQGGAALACAACMEQLGDLAGARACLDETLRRMPPNDELRAPLLNALDALGQREVDARRARGETVQ